jgi:cell division septation protein DedD
MRFEIKTGGWILILFGLTGLSLIVFALGLFAGYDMARSTAPEAPQAASVYPLPNPPQTADVGKASAKSADELASTQSAATKPTTKTKASAGVDTSASSVPMDKNAGQVAVPSSRTVANATGPVSAPKVAPPSQEKFRTTKPVTEPAATSPVDKYVSETDSTSVRHKPFNIQIDAVMDRTNAEQMTARLQKLGYRAFMVPTDISGQTWWRVRVGPYQSQEEASAAEQELRAKYKDTYVP